MTVEAVQVVDRVADAESRMQIEQQMNVAERTRKIEQRDVLVRMRRQLHAEIHRDGGRADAALRTHHDDQRSSDERSFESSRSCVNRVRISLSDRGVDGLWQEILHAASHRFEQKLMVWRNDGGTRDQFYGRPNSVNLRAQLKIRLRIAPEIQKHNIRQGI